MAKITKPLTGDNYLNITKKPEDGGQTYKHYGLDVDKIITGVEDETQTEIIKNENTGLNEARNLVYGQEIYNTKTQKHSCWFILDLETGSRGWCPGCIIRASTLSGSSIPNPIPIYKEADETSEQLGTVDPLNYVDILDGNAVVDLPIKPTWYNIKYNNIIGYIKNAYLSDPEYYYFDD